MIDYKPSFQITQNKRSKLMGHFPKVIWFTGISGSGKSTLANLLDIELYKKNIHTYTLDGDHLRNGLNKDLGFGDSDRSENIRRAAEVAKLMSEAGLVVICSFISPFELDRKMAREIIGNAQFVEIFLDCPLKECIERDPKGLYKKALNGDIKNFTGIDSPYEKPESSE
jgi:bifunctional enzyme CysN/CysC